MTSLALALALLFPLHSHTQAEQKEWKAEWVERVRTEKLTPKLLGEYLDFQERHAPRVVNDPSPLTSSTTSAVDRGMGPGVEQWRGLVSAYPWDTNTALCLMSYESGGNPNARNPSSGASGLMQVLPSWAPKFGVSVDALFDPVVNLEISYALYADGGWGHWSPWNRGLCR